MKNNPTIILKVPEGLYKRANEKGLLKEVLFYYQLKSLNIEGRLYSGEISKTLKSVFNIPEGSVWKKIKNLVSIGFLKKQSYTLPINIL